MPKYLVFPRAWLVRYQKQNNPDLKDLLYLKMRYAKSNFDIEKDPKYSI